MILSTNFSRKTNNNKISKYYVGRLPYDHMLRPYLALDAVYLVDFNCMISNLYDKRDAIIIKLLSLLFYCYLVCPARADWHCIRFNGRAFFINELFAMFIRIQLFIIIFLFFFYRMKSNMCVTLLWCLAFTASAFGQTDVNG